MIDRAFILSNERAAKVALDYIDQHWKAAVELGTPLFIQIRDFSDKRTDDQNRKLHAMCGDLAEQVQWAGEKLDTEDWKRLLVASIHGQKVILGIDGQGFVVLNKRTSKMNKADVGEVIEALYAFGAERGVRWSDEIPA